MDPLHQQGAWEIETQSQGLGSVASRLLGKGCCGEEEGRGGCHLDEGELAARRREAGTEQL